MASGIRRVGSWITALGSEITSHGIRISSFLRDQGSGCTIVVGSGNTICHAFGIKGQKFGYKNGIGDEKNIPRYNPAIDNRGGALSWGWYTMSRVHF